MSTYDYTFKILLLGDASVEKTSFTKRYCYNIFNPSERLTIGVDFHVKTIELQGKKIKLQIWDVGGEERFRFLLPTYCLGANGVFLIYDITKAESLNNINEWINVVRQKGGPIPIMLIGANIHLKCNRAVSREEGIEIAESHYLNGFTEISAKTGQNVTRAFETLSDIMLKEIDPGKRRKYSSVKVDISDTQEIPGIDELLRAIFGEGNSIFGGIDDFGYGGFRSRARRRKTHRREVGQDIEKCLKIPFEEAMFGTKKDIKIKRDTPCDTCEGTGKTRGKKCKVCNGRKVVSEDKMIHLNIPAGVEDGVYLRVLGAGHISSVNAIPGDLYVRLKIDERDEFIRISSDNTLKYWEPLRMKIKNIFRLIRDFLKKP